VLRDEPDVRTELKAGAALVLASGDKLLGGPQCGLIFGSADLVRNLRKNPLARAMRVDKTTLAALEATITGPPTPLRDQLHAAMADLHLRALALAQQLSEAAISADVVDSTAMVGGGAAPGVELPSQALALPASLALPLRAGTPPVIGRVRDGHLLLDLRTVTPGDDHLLAQCVITASS
jgi:L-seryl-tRNA(Ser) seleniumtransferase